MIFAKVTIELAAQVRDLLVGNSSGQRAPRARHRQRHLPRRPPARDRLLKGGAIRLLRPSDIAGPPQAALDHTARLRGNRGMESYRQAAFIRAANGAGHVDALPACGRSLSHLRRARTGGWRSTLARGRQPPFRDQSDQLCRRPQATAHRSSRRADTGTVQCGGTDTAFKRTGTVQIDASSTGNSPGLARCRGPKRLGDERRH